MKIKSIRFSENTSSFWDNIIGWILLLLGILLVVIFVLCLPFIFIYNFIRRKIFKIKDEEPDILEMVLFENERLKIIEKDISREDEADFIYDFFGNIGEELLIYKLIDQKQPSSLGNTYIMDFHFLDGKKLCLQKVSKENGKTTTHLIGFDLETEKVEIIGEIGHYILMNYDKKTRSITGFGEDNDIKIELE